MAPENAACRDCERCRWQPDVDCGITEHPHCPRCGHCQGRHGPEVSTEPTSAAALTAAQRSLSVRLSGLLGEHGHGLMKIYPDKKASECMTLAARDLDVFMDRIREAFDA